MIINPTQMEYLLDFNGHKLCAIIQNISDSKVLRMEIDGKTVDAVMLPADTNHGFVKVLQKRVSEYVQEKHDKYADIITSHLDKLKVVSKKMYVAIEEMGIKIDLCVISEKGVYTLKFSVNELMDDMICHIVADSLSEALEKSRIFTHIMMGINQEMTANLTEFSEDGILEELGWYE